MPDPFRTLEELVAGRTRLAGLSLSDTAFVLSALKRDTAGVWLWICKDNREAEVVASDLRFFGGNRSGSTEVLVVPGFEADPYRGLSPHPELAEARAFGLWRLASGFHGFVVTTVFSLLTRLVSPEHFLKSCQILEVAGTCPLDPLLRNLTLGGYLREDAVSDVGEFSHRGGIVDVFSPAHEKPVRIEFFGDEIDSIREFDPATQRSIALIPQCQIIPMREAVVTAQEIADWHQKAPRYWNRVRFAESLEEKLQFTQAGDLFNGLEFLFPLVRENRCCLLDYLAGKTSGFALILRQAEDALSEIDRLHQRLQQDFNDQDQAGELVLSPSQLFFGRGEVERWLKSEKVFDVQDLGEASPKWCFLDFHSEREYQSRMQDLLGDLKKWRRAGETVLFVMPSRGMAERLVDVLGEYEVHVHFETNGFAAALRHPLSVAEGSLSHGFHAPPLKLHLLNEANVFGRPQAKPTPRRTGLRELSAPFLSDFRDLRGGDYVVHVEHGIGCFKGLKRIGVGNGEQEFVELVYRDSAKLYVPVDRLDQLQKFSGAGQPKPRLDRLGGTSWERTKGRIKKSVRQLAEDLLKLYAQRQVSRGHAFDADDELMKEFEEAFEFEETTDQKRAIEDVKRDMELPRPMDRLICGDVGYGKTEVAMRAAFKAVTSSYQVAVLAPTTVLAFQHFNTFKERFKGFPVTVEMISRFRSRREQEGIVERVKLGLVDILIGTHRLLSKDIHFRKLGLVVIDEEQRFGVAQKEKLKAMRTEVDVLALSATPIPRTLNMSLVGVRDLSLIESPPRDRLAIQTVVVKFNRNIIRSAIDLEMKRGGQVFFVHNSIDTIHAVADMVRKIVPEARVCVAHGQMRERQLEEVMLAFLDYRYDILVTTTIIENGLDIARANTLVVNRAHHFGLAQLYQLRGRVGRSSRRAYAYLLIPPEETVTTPARKRLAAIREFSDLGTGFRVAALDLEIRGAGNLLGAEQHGHINAVGLELYMKLLEQTIQELKGEEVSEAVQTSIDLGLDIQIPAHYIDDSNQRLWLYKRISSVRDGDGLQSLRTEIVDRFGKYPRTVSNLFEYARLRLRAREMKIVGIERKDSVLLLKFRQDTPVSVDSLVPLVSRDESLSLAPEGVLKVAGLPIGTPDVFEGLHQILDRLAVLE